MSAVDFKAEFMVDSELIYLNHAAVAPWPQRTRDAVVRFADENLRFGSRRYAEWVEVEQSLKRMVAELLNAPTEDDIALLKNTSEGLSLVAQGIDWQSGDSVVSLAEEFPSNRIPWEALADQGVALKTVSIFSDDPEQALMNRCGPETRVLSVSSVQYTNGLRLDLRRLGNFCHSHGILFCVDAIQSLGAFPFDVQAWHVDFVAADGHKWMLGPEGLAIFYCRRELYNHLKLRQFGWRMVEDAGNFSRQTWCPAKNARRFEAGSPNMLSIHALHASLSLIRDFGIQRIDEKIISNTKYLMNKLRQLGCEILSPNSECRLSGIVTFRLPDHDQKVIYHQLMDNGVICALRGGGIRFSPHFYNQVDEFDRACEILSAL